MRILLDESLPGKPGQALAGREVRTVQQAGWSGLENGELLRRAKGSFDVFVTGDQYLEFQQSAASLTGGRNALPSSDVEWAPPR